MTDCTAQPATDDRAAEAEREQTTQQNQRNSRDTQVHAGRRRLFRW